MVKLSFHAKPTFLFFCRRCGIIIIIYISKAIYNCLRLDTNVDLLNAMLNLLLARAYLALQHSYLISENRYLTANLIFIALPAV